MKWKANCNNNGFCFFERLFSFLVNETCASYRIQTTLDFRWLSLPCILFTDPSIGNQFASVLYFIQVDFSYVSLSFSGSTFLSLPLWHCRLFWWSKSAEDRDREEAVGNFLQKFGLNVYLYTHKYMLYIGQCRLFFEQCFWWLQKPATKINTFIVTQA